MGVHALSLQLTATRSAHSVQATAPFTHSIVNIPAHPQPDTV